MKVLIVAQGIHPLTIDLALGMLFSDLDDLAGEEEEIEPNVFIGKKTKIDFTMPEADKEEVRKIIKRYITVEKIEID